MKPKTVLYIHGRGGRVEEADHYRPLFPSYDVIGIEYTGDTPWEAGAEIRRAVIELNCGSILLIANSIGAFFAMHADIGNYVEHAYFISPIVDMEKLITEMMSRAHVTESALQKSGIICTDPGDVLSWKYLCYVREHPVCWNVPTDILYGSRDSLTSMETMAAFAHKIHAGLTVMDRGEHWFHTDAQMHFLDHWIQCRQKESA